MRTMLTARSDSWIEEDEAKLAMRAVEVMHHLVEVSHCPNSVSTCVC